MKKTLFYSLLTIFIVLQSAAFSQTTKAAIKDAEKIGTGKKSEIFEAKLVKKVNAKSVDLDWNPILTVKIDRVEHKLPGKDECDAIKAEKLANKTTFGSIADTDDKPEFTGATPIVSTEFNGNPSSGSSPMDNSIAISNGGKIVSVANTTIQFKTTGGGTTFFSSIVDFIDDPSISYVCDPVVIYDPQEDRFIFFAQECSGHSSNSNLLIMFSQTNDPGDGWNYYKLTGNPLGDNSWFDYPKLAISDTELFISGNLFTNAGSFNQSVVYQMEKADGYSGAGLTWQYWYDIAGTPGTILVVSSGNEYNYGPGIYMVSTQPFAGNTIKFYDITDAIAGSPELNYYSVSTTSYDVAADASQLGTSCTLDIGDCRCLSGFYLNGIIHFVFQSDVGSSWNGINYNRLDVASLSNTSDKFGNAGTRDYGYPSIAWFGLSPADKSVIINFGSTNSSHYPRVNVVHCNDAGEWSDITIVKESNSYACFTSPSNERWGDYTGAVRKHNATEPAVWINGMYGTGTHRWNTWIAEIEGEYTASVNELITQENIVIAPNPISETFVLSFETIQDLPVEIQILGIDGRIVKNLYTGTAYIGQNQFAFNKANLASGTYFLQVISNGNQIANEKIIIR